MDINQYDKLNQYNQNNYRLQPLFSSFLAEFQLDIDHNKVRDWIYAQAEDCTNRVNLTFDEPELQEYYSATMDAIDKVHYDTGLSQQWKHVFKQGWANADNHDRFDLAHTHPRASFVSVYYPEVLDGEFGPLELINPVTEAQMVIHSERDYNCTAAFNQYTAQRWRVEPKTGKLVIFPSWVQHHAMPKLSPGGRLSIALNSFIVPNDNNPMLELRGQDIYTCLE